MNYESGKYKNIHYGDILIKLPTLVDCNNILLPFVNDNILVSPKLNLLKTGDIVIADTAEDYTAGKAIEIKNKSSRVISGLHTISCRPNFEFYNGYLGYYLNSFTFRKNLLPLVQGIKVYSVSKYMYNFLFINYPSLMEQKKITNLLLNIDARIQTQNKIIEDLNKLKKSLIDDKFTNAEFSVSLKEVLIERKSYSEKGLEYEHVTLSKDGIIPKGERYDRDFLVTDESKEYKIKKLNDICYNPANLKFGVICLNNYKDSIFSPIYVTFEVDKKYNPYYVSLYLTSDRFIKKILKYQQGTVYERMSVNPDDFLKGRLPIIKNQESFISLIKTIDNKCTVEKELLKTFEIQKAHLLKNMFI